MAQSKEITIQDREWAKVLQELIDAGVTKEEFKQFLAKKKKEKNLSK